MNKYEIAAVIGDYALLRKGGKFYVSHTSVKEPVEIEASLLLLLFKRVLRESMGL